MAETMDLIRRAQRETQAALTPVATLPVAVPDAAAPAVAPQGTSNPGPARMTAPLFDPLPPTAPLGVSMTGQNQTHGPFSATAAAPAQQRAWHGPPLGFPFAPAQALDHAPFGNRPVRPIKAKTDVIMGPAPWGDNPPQTLRDLLTYIRSDSFPSWSSVQLYRGDRSRLSIRFYDAPAAARFIQVWAAERSRFPQYASIQADLKDI
jgi:hypothetical protein